MVRFAIISIVTKHLYRIVGVAVQCQPETSILDHLRSLRINDPMVVNKLTQNASAGKVIVFLVRLVNDDNMEISYESADKFKLKDLIENINVKIPITLSITEVDRVEVDDDGCFL